MELTQALRVAATLSGLKPITHSLQVAPAALNAMKIPEITFSMALLEGRQEISIAWGLFSTDNQGEFRAQLFSHVCLIISTVRCWSTPAAHSS